MTAVIIFGKVTDTKITVVCSTDKGPETVAVIITISFALATGVSRRATVVLAKAN